MMVFTDGSFSKKPNVGGAGYIILSQNHEITGGRYLFNCSDNNVAEVFAIYSALKFIEKHNFKDKTIQIISDSDYALRKINLNKEGRNEMESIFLKYIQEFQQKTNKKISFMLVKGHKHDKTKISFYNNLADEIAREQRLLGIERYKQTIKNKYRD